MKRFLYISINYTMLNPFWGPRISLISIYNMLYFEFRLGPQYWFGSRFKQFRILTTYTSSGINIGLTGAGFFENILRHKLYRFVIVSWFSPFWKGVSPLLQQLWIPLQYGSFAQRLVIYGPVHLENKWKEEENATF